MAHFNINTTEKCKNFNNIISILSNVIDEINMTFEEDHLYVQCMDDSHICLVELKLMSDWFSEFKCDETVNIGIKLSILTKILSCYQDQQQITFNYENETDKINISFINGEKCKAIEKHFETVIFDYDYDTLEIHDTEYQLDITIESVLLKKLIDQLSSFGNKVTFTCDDETIVLCNSESLNNTVMKVNIDITDLDEYSIEENTVVNETFDIKLMQRITNFSKIANLTKIGLSRELPIHLTYSLDDNSSIQFWVAPVIKD
uniref:Proliferating cell nuclear antigen PCNA N-terminal domain-containing protein n=1 Tax=viral metagenome TaxID=1070528 RepID=A0A6C0KEM0_9ZZZZ